MSNGQQQKMTEQNQQQNEDIVDADDVADNLAAASGAP